jgi:hypothetical protein
MNTTSQPNPASQAFDIHAKLKAANSHWFIYELHSLIRMILITNLTPLLLMVWNSLSTNV